MFESIYQADLASLMDSEKPHIRKLEKGKRNATVSTLLKLSNALGVSVSELVDVGV
ncbi:MAG TPA: helix-turn-helix transcriptional regulator [Bacteroidales bacterium]|nr:helix-turn-helix transcriptional regulator [Bacteroidales bacterium]